MFDNVNIWLLYDSNTTTNSVEGDCMGKIRKIIEAELVKKGMSKKEFANKLGMFPNNVAQLLKSKRPQTVTINKVAKALDMEPVLFFEAMN